MGNKRFSSLVEDVKFISRDMVFNRRGRLNIKEALNLLADRYELSHNQEDYVYLIAKACHADEPNSNGDGFKLAELERFDAKYGCKVYQTFIGKPHFREHNQNGPAYGFVLDAHLVKDSKEAPYVELVIAIDSTKDKEYGRMVVEGRVRTKYSMGCTVDYTECSICGNRAYSEKEFCDHIRFGKLKHFTINGKRVKAFEWCYGVRYDEISNVDDPADPEALEEERLVAASTKKTAARVSIGDWFVTPKIISPENKSVLPGGLIGQVSDIVGNMYFFNFPIGEQPGTMFVKTTDHKDKEIPVKGNEDIILAAEEEGWELTGFKPLTQNSNWEDEARNYNTINEGSPASSNNIDKNKITDEYVNRVKDVLVNIVNSGVEELIQKDIPWYDTEVVKRDPKNRTIEEIESLFSKRIDKIITRAKQLDVPVEDALSINEAWQNRTNYIDSRKRHFSKLSDIVSGKTDAELTEWVRTELLRTDNKAMLALFSIEPAKYIHPTSIPEYQEMASEKIMQEEKAEHNMELTAPSSFEIGKNSRVVKAEGPAAIPAITPSSDTTNNSYNNSPQDYNWIKKDMPEAFGQGKVTDIESAKSWFANEYGTAPTEEQTKQMQENLEGYKNLQTAKGGKTMPGRKYVIEELDKKAGDIKFPGYKSWFVEVNNYRDKKIAVLTDGKKSSFKKLLGSDVKESEFASVVLNDLVKIGLKGVTKKYAFAPKFNAVTEDGAVDKDPGSLKPREDRATADGETDKEGFTGDKNVTKEVTDEATFDKEGSKNKKADNGGERIPLKKDDRLPSGLNVSVPLWDSKKPERFGVYTTVTGDITDANDEFITFTLDKWEGSHRGKREHFFFNVVSIDNNRILTYEIPKGDTAEIDRFSESFPLAKEDLNKPYEIGGSKKKDKKEDKKKDEKKKDKKKKHSYLKIGELADNLAFGYNKRYEKSKGMTIDAARRAVVNIFGSGLQISGSGKIEKFADDIQENSDSIDIPGVVEELVTFYVDDEKMSTEEVADAFDKFIVEDAPEEIKEELITDVKEVADSVAQEETEEGSEIPADVTIDDIAVTDSTDEKADEKADEGADEKADEGADEKGDIEVNPSNKEIGIEDIRVESSKKAEELNRSFRAKYRRAIQLAAKRQMLNIETAGLFRIKEGVCQNLIQPHTRFAGIKNDVAVELVERAFNKIMASDMVNELLSSADKLVDMNDEAFLQVESDISSLKPASVTASTKTAAKNGEAVPLGRTGSRLLGGDGDLNIEMIKAALPSFGFGQKKNR